MKRCPTCGSELILRSGTIVEVLPAFSHDLRIGLAVILSEQPLNSPPQDEAWSRVVLITGERTGTILAVPRVNLCAIYGTITNGKVYREKDDSNG